MADTNRARTRLRKAFRYPDEDDSSDSLPEAIDEQEQEALIRRLAAENAARDIQFQRLLLALPLLSAIPFLVVDPFSSSSWLALSSLLSTAYLLYALPPAETGIPFLDAVVSPRKTALRAQRRAAAAPFLPLSDKSPLEAYLPYLNLALCALAALSSALSSGKAKPEGLIKLGYLPTLVYFLVLVAKMAMGGVDPEGELGVLRYGYKGA
ncbi:hypothetical protein SODALDRAFT_348534 [Sodiomyces alkalinus F11]|uniref:Uncharacterized protein n=1 Tax=Sodiomyces alkalinus (strain CBS 110278 / VKM F-3762 / F11) TaxID=1314773 RepID=A0A3N2Q0G0_SODAK|nr:hypothetical protein SODALDRAFT_348534 [Sodiomyces alkalinus F11]ROT40249.1 hypothetical protein SODALDRAFT_348534 [Sodiomyces alkalinus F11]